MQNSTNVTGSYNQRVGPDLRGHGGHLVPPCQLRGCIRVQDEAVSIYFICLFAFETRFHLVKAGLELIL